MKFQQSLLPDLERISTTSKDYIKQYNKEITKNFKPIVSNKYASIIALIVSPIPIPHQLTHVASLLKRIFPLSTVKTEKLKRPSWVPEKLKRKFRFLRTQIVKLENKKENMNRKGTCFKSQNPS